VERERAVQQCCRAIEIVSANEEFSVDQALSMALAEQDVKDEERRLAEEFERSREDEA